MGNTTFYRRSTHTRNDTLIWSTKFGKSLCQLWGALDFILAAWIFQHGRGHIEFSATILCSIGWRLCKWRDLQTLNTEERTGENLKGCFAGLEKRIDEDVVAVVVDYALDWLEVAHKFMVCLDAANETTPVPAELDDELWFWARFLGERFPQKTVSKS